MIPETISNNFFLREKFHFSFLNELLTVEKYFAESRRSGMRRQRVKLEQTNMKYVETN